MAIAKIGKFTLYNGGGFVARGAVAYLDSYGEKKLSGNTGDIDLGMTRDVNPGDLGVSDGSIIDLYVYVRGGTDNEAGQSFVFAKGNSTVANYGITGTTTINTLRLISVG